MNLNFKPLGDRVLIQPTENKEKRRDPKTNVRKKLLNKNLGFILL